MATSPRPVPPDALLQRIRGEYLEPPSLRLTPAQARRLFGLEPDMCGATLEALLNEHFLVCTNEGLFVRSTAVA